MPMERYRRGVTGERINLVVLFGGQSAEHDVSRTTAAHVLAAADPSKYRVTPIGISTDGEWALATEAAAALSRGPGDAARSTRPDRRPLSPTTMLGEAADSPERTVVLPLLHGPMGEDGTVQGLLELANVAYVGSGVLGSAVAMDKAMAKQILGAAGIAQARYRAFAEHQITPGLPDELADELGLPCFVKPANMGSSVGVSKARTIEEFRDAIDYALTYDEWVVVEEAIDGREIEIAVIGNEDPFVSVPGEIVPGDEFYSYDDKYVNDASTGHHPRPDHPGADRRHHGEGAGRLPSAAVRRSRTLRLLPRGVAACSRVPLQRGEHDAGVHPDLDVPEDADRERHDLRRDHRSPGRVGRRTPPAPTPQHQALTARPAQGV